MTTKSGRTLDAARLGQDLAGLLAGGASLLQTESEPLAERVHEARKRIKRARAWAALLGGDEAAELERALAALHRAFAGQRDHDACVEALQRLQLRAKPALRALLQRWQAALTAPSDSALPQLPLHALAAEFTTMAERVGCWPPSAQAPSLLRGLVASYRESRRRCRRATRSGKVRDLHRWRRWMKAQAYQFRYLEPLWPELLTAVAVAAEETAECLGEHQDIELVRARVDAVAWTPAERATLIALLDRTQRRLARKALAQGARLHAEAPKALRRRFEAYWVAARL